MHGLAVSVKEGVSFVQDLSIETSIAKSYHPVSLLSVVSKVFLKFVNNRIIGQLEKCGFFSDFQYGFRSS